MDKPHILVVDDNHINRLFFESSLKKLLCEVETAADGFEAVELCSKTQFDLILMDIRMNGMNGIESAHQIHQKGQNINTRIVAVSAEIFQLENPTDFVDSLLKPVKQATLSQLITKYSYKKLIFNHSKALTISHHDEKIVSHLRELFISQLQQHKSIITDLYHQHELDELHHELHQLLGSATICAAELMVDSIQRFKTDLNDSNQSIQQKSFQQLMTAIDSTSYGLNE